MYNISAWWDYDDFEYRLRSFRHFNATGLPGGSLRSLLQERPLAKNLLFPVLQQRRSRHCKTGKREKVIKGQRGCSEERDIPPGKPVAS